MSTGSEFARIRLQWTLYPNEGNKHLVYEAPSWTRLIWLLDVVFFVPIIILVNYTLSQIYPVLAIPSRLTRSTSAHSQKYILTSSLRSINDLLRKHGGFMANFRGFLFAFVHEGLSRIIALFFKEPLGPYFSAIASLFASLVLVQFSTAWVHVIISRSQMSSLLFFRRLPPFSRTFEAIWKTVILSWAANEAARWLPNLLSSWLGIEWPELRLFTPDNTYAFSQNLAWGGAVFYAKVVFVIIFSTFGSIFIVIPAKVALVRIQASLLPIEYDTIVPFDRSYHGKVKPIPMGGRGYATIADVWSTFTLDGWHSLTILSAKIATVSLLVTFSICLILTLEWTILVTKSLELNQPM
ncbi:hypothetical protein PT974_05181 [Cladobotryum mycophilum]|uniref:Uncharacterized protein n=1 Tax=Cladobotryum mycophilum TaxID=491253 RepID=A0ABR0SPY7_9HYPO